MFILLLIYFQQPIESVIDYQRDSGQGCHFRNNILQAAIVMHVIRTVSAKAFQLTYDRVLL